MLPPSFSFYTSEKENEKEQEEKKKKKKNWENSHTLIITYDNIG